MMLRKRKKFTHADSSLETDSSDDYVEESKGVGEIILYTLVNSPILMLFLNLIRIKINKYQKIMSVKRIVYARYQVKIHPKTFSRHQIIHQKAEARKSKNMWTKFVSLRRMS